MWRRQRTSAISAMPLGAPGWPELAFCTASMARARMAPVIGLKAMLRVLLAADTMKSPIGKKAKLSAKTEGFSSR